MIALNKITGAAKHVAPRTNGGACAPNAANQSGAVRSSPLWPQPSNLNGEAGAPSILPTFSFRTEPCSVCDPATATSCDYCWSSGKVDAVCVECERDRPLNDEGVCRRCFDAGELPLAEYRARYLHTQAMQSREAY